MRVDDLFRDLNIPYVSEGTKHCRPGWINMECPFCVGNPGYHLGFSLTDEYFHCWRCGGHPIIETLTKLTGLPSEQIRYLLRQYGGKSRIKTKEKTAVVRTRAFRYPSGTGDLQKNHFQYLESRNFDPEKIVDTWGIMGTGPVSKLDDIDYKLRIVAPILWGGKVVSFQARSINKKEEVKYKACPMNREIIHHKHILYGLPDLWTGVGICVEGITDVWRLGTYAFAVFGIEYKIAQVQQIAKHFHTVHVLFDDDPHAQKQAKKLVAELKLRGLKARRIIISGDPGALPQDDADHLVSSLLKGGT